MRTTPLIGKKLWFGPRDGGWGWQPESTEGWVTSWVLVGAAVVAAVSSTWWPRSGFLAFGVCIALLVGLGALKGTAPGGSKKRREFELLRNDDIAKHFDVRRLPDGPA